MGHAYSIQLAKLMGARRDISATTPFRTRLDPVPVSVPVPPVLAAYATERNIMCRRFTFSCSTVLAEEGAAAAAALDSDTRLLPRKDRKYLCGNGVIDYIRIAHHALISTAPPSSPPSSTATMASSSSLTSPSSRPLLMSASSSISTASTIGTIIAVVAVFDIHIERNIVGSISPNMSL